MILVSLKVRDMWNWLSESPIGAAFAGLGIGIIGMLYFLGITFAPDETEDREHTELDETQPVAMMPSFNDPDEAIAWHDEQKRRYEQLKKENHDLSKLVELLESTVIQIEHLKTDMDELRRERNERNENKINTGIDSLAVDGGNAGISTGSDPGA